MESIPRVNNFEVNIKFLYQIRSVQCVKKIWVEFSSWKYKHEIGDFNNVAFDKYNIYILSGT